MAKHIQKVLALRGIIGDADVIRRRTRRVGRFEFRVALPSEVNPEGVDAKLNDGVLTVRIPKAALAQRRRIEVKSA